MKLIVGKSDNPVIVLNAVFAKQLEKTGNTRVLNYIGSSWNPTATLPSTLNESGKWYLL